MREAWADERLDELAARMDAGFERVDAALRALRTEMNGFNSETNGRFDSMQRTMAQGFVALGASTLTGFVALFALIATKL
jgi:hypothetical protein